MVLIIFAIVYNRSGFGIAIAFAIFRQVKPNWLNMWIKIPYTYKKKCFDI